MVGNAFGPLGGKIVGLLFIWKKKKLERKDLNPERDTLPLIIGGELGEATIPGASRLASPQKETNKIQEKLPRSKI